MVPGSMYAEEAEARLRMREAVVSALSAAGYRARDEERIGAWKLAWPRQVPPLGFKALDKISADQTVDVLFPFEWFALRQNITPIHKSPDSVLVIWLPDSPANLSRTSAKQGITYPEGVNRHGTYSSCPLR